MRGARVVAVLLACVVVAAAGAASAAAAGKKKDGSTVMLSWEEFKLLTGWKPLLPGPGEVLIPWSDVEQLVDIKIKDVGVQSKVKLPWKEFRALIEYSVARRQGEDKVPPPADYVITKAVYTGQLAKEIATFDLSLTVDVLRKTGWKRIRLLPATVGINQATLPQGSFLNVSGNTYELLTQATGTQAVKLSFATTVTEDAGMNSVSFERVPSGTCLLDLSVAQPDVKLMVAGAQAIKPPAGMKVAGKLFALPAGNRVAVSWEREIKEAKKGPAKLYAQTQTLVAVSDGIVTCREGVVYSIVHAGVRELTLDVPDGVNLLDVSCRYLHDWRTEGKQLKLQLSREVQGVHRVDLTFESAAAQTGGRLNAPVISTTGTQRERGFVAVVALTNVEIAGQPGAGVSTIDSGSLPSELLGWTSQPVLLAYRYVGNKASVPLQVTKHKDVKVLVTVVDAATFTVMQTVDGRRIISAVYDVRNNRNQFLRIMMPKQTKIWSVTVAGKAARPALDAQGQTLIPLVRSSGQHLAAFPVEIVYVDESFKPVSTGDDAGCGKITVRFPQCAPPVMNVMCKLYVPKEGRYENFTGSLSRVTDFRQLHLQETVEGKPVVRRAGQQAQRIQTLVDNRLGREAPQGVRPIKVKLPTSGAVFNFQKILVLGEELWVELSYTHWPGYSSSWW